MEEVEREVTDGGGGERERGIVNWRDDDRGRERST